ncbi:hypothetical protein MAR_031883, partial [Mya arenaria]
SVQGIWALCFDKLVQQKVVAQAYEGGVVSFLWDFKQSASLKVTQACNGALWTLKDMLRTSKVQKYKEIGEQLESSTEKKKESEPDKAVNRENITGSSSESQGHVWMDIDEMGGSTIQAMAEAVENADLVHAEPPRGNDTPDGVSMTTVAKVPVTLATIQAVRKWSPDEVNQWRKKNNIASSVPKLKSGEEVAFLLTMRAESPDF